MKQITCWEVQTKEGTKHNHIEDGWVDGDYPKPKHPSFQLQKSWKNQKWRKLLCFLDNNYKVVGKEI